jgi:Carboxypeptidase regulatory-like domain
MFPFKRLQLPVLTLCAFALTATVSFVPNVGTRTAYAQVTVSQIHGTVTDASDAVVPGAKVTALNTATGISVVATTSASGYYIFTALQPGGPYTVTVEAQGFEKYEAKGITLIVNANWDADAKLKIGSNQQSVTVDATALQVETSNTQLEQVATADQIEGIPLAGRDASGLQKLEPGVVESSDRFGSFSSNGNETPQNSFLISGIDINDPALQSEGIQINPDAIQEENIVTSTMNPEFSRNSGAVINQVLKNGTNKLHGSGFEFYRDTFMNNGDYFSPTRPVFHQNLYGGTLGGPVFRNKLFFFLGYQGLRNRTAQTSTPETLNADQFNGNFTNDTNYANSGAPNSAGLTNNAIPFNITTSAGTCVADPGAKKPETWADCFNSGIVNIPTSAWNPVASNLIKTYVPQSNLTLGNQAYYNFNPVNTEGSDQGIMRVDFTPSSRDSIWAASIFQSAPSASTLTFGGGSFPGFGSVEANHYKLFSASWTHTFTPTKLNELRASYYRNPFGAVGVAQVVQPSSLGFSINPQDPQSGVPYLGIGNYFNLGFSFEGPQPRLDTNLTYADNFTWIRGSHTIKFGGLFEQFRVHNPFDLYNNGLYSFNGAGTYSSGDPLVDFALGIPDSFNQTNNGFINAVSEEIYGYVQDNWKVSPDFTFNFGLAWDVEKPNMNHQDGGLGIVCWQNSSAESGVFPGAPPGLGFPGDPGCNNAGSPVPHYNRFGPRIGFAWSPSSGPSKLIGTPGAHDLSIRAGFGLYYNRDQEEQSLQNLEDPPFLYVSHGAADLGGSPSLANPYTDVTGDASVSEANPFPYTAPTAGATVNWPLYSELELAAFDKSYSVPYTYNYNINIQRSIGGNMVAQIGYVGSVSHRLPSWFDGDGITPAGHAACLTDPVCSGNPAFVRLLDPQYAAQPAIVPGTAGGGLGGNGIPWYLSVGDQNSEGSSNYNSFQASLIKAPSHGLQFTVAYTYSHALDDGSGYESATGSGGRVHNFVPGFSYLNYGSSDFDARHRISTSYVYTVPVAGFLRNNVIAREALGGWGISGVTALQTGFPVGINYGTQNSLWCDEFSYFGCPDVPNTSNFHLKQSNIRSATNQFFDTTPFSAEPLGTFGNTTRNFLHGPGFDYTNLSVTKNIHFSADNARYIQLRLEAFNAFNHANFANPNGTFLSGSFGRVTAVDHSADPNSDPTPGRVIQIAGKFYF